MWKTNLKSPLGDGLRHWLAISIILATLVWADGSAQAASRYVPTQYATIQDAIDASSDGEAVIVADGIYTGLGNRDIDFMGKGITVRSENGPENCIINCQGTEIEPHRGFYFHSGEDGNSVADGFTITGGYAGPSSDEHHGCGGGLYCKQSCPSITNCTFKDNRAEWGGAGAYCYYNSSPTLNNCTFSSNTIEFPDSGWGGGMHNAPPCSLRCTVRVVISQ